MEGAWLYCGTLSDNNTYQQSKSYVAPE